MTNYDGSFLFSECTGLLMEVALPDYNGDSITDLRDFTLLAKQHGNYVNEETACTMTMMPAEGWLKQQTRWGM